MESPERLYDNFGVPLHGEQPAGTEPRAPEGGARGSGSFWLVGATWYDPRLKRFRSVWRDDRGHTNMTWR